MIPNLLSHKRAIPTPALCLLLAALLASTSGCGGNRTAEKIAQDSSAAQRSQTSLIFNDVTLEQVDEQGRLVWKVEAARATYSQDEKIAFVENPEGELYQDGQLVFRVVAERGEVQQDGQQILLKGNIVATDVQDGAVLRGKELEWRPDSDELIVRHTITGTHPQVNAQAKEARMYSRARRMELEGEVIATTVEPKLQMRTEKLIWNMKENKIIGPVPVEIDRFAEDREDAVIQQAQGQTAEVDLEAKTALLKQDAYLVSIEPPMEVRSEAVTWNLESDLVESPGFVNVVHTEQQVTLTGDRGRVDLAQQIAYIVGNVRGIGQRNQSQLGADTITWSFPTQKMEAQGNVTYQQADPPLNLRGAKAVGSLENQTIVVSSGNTNGPVITEIIP
ncbi:LPS export ABC transporter periplasmic protein LptC [Desertifilum sp. FACHB-1129]|uniref:LPS export ABC transporter periplasmic protein LptC n=1 Tax=Desertifilum tharense IPPAS B-1220 TaxID=1781255 RepID=A0A1E5QEE1_9CYAN|nr:MULTISPECIES: LPS export ABC transporter periplasmic protein LptC [Desertifilum]MCD8490185.1 LPS export ABC transporter periplasmic protein LptC [Desertifilum sp.]MDA0213423.1 LPS export ABC transporter periplasmic protein LptC [Cyanobacteria bacterium FC1]MDI9635957.1 LPS export ABC transporter periplasmic protein LptC [Geitlerinema splendidum]MBD2314893.1 LPS export ABC transporter periplasmic protein LptC [Desertifilum sp. FACHB-1129]MBD2322905.1 LPS export ABC transporter periplasmic pr